MENKLDNFFKNKLDEREVVFNEAHWEQAEFLLDQADEEAQQRAWWRYWVLGSFVLFFIVGMVWCFAWGDVFNKNTQHDSLTIQEESVSNNRNNFNKNKTAETTNTNSETNSAITNDVTNTTLDLSETEEADNKNTNPERLNNFSKKENNKTSLADINSKKEPLSNTTQEKRDANSFENKNTWTAIANKQNTDLKNTIKEEYVSGEKSNIVKKEIETSRIENLPRNENRGVEENTKNTISTNASTTDNQLSEQNKNTESVWNKTDQQDQKKPSSISMGQVVALENSVSTIEDAEGLEYKEENITYLEKAFNLLDIPDKKLDDAVPVIELKKIEPATEKGWRLGVTASALVYPFANSSDASYSDFPDINRTVSAQHFTGFKVGPTVDYSIHRRWGLHTAILYYQQTGTFQSVRSSRQIQYRFGVESSTVELVPQSLHYLEIPLLAVRKWNKHGLELGLSTNFLVRVKTQYGKYMYTDAEVPVLNEPTTSWAYKDGFSKLHFRGLLGYQYQVTKRWQVGLRMNYILGSGVLDKNYEAPRRFILLENKPVNFELKLSYRF